METSIQVRAIPGRPTAGWGEAVALPLMKGKSAPKGRLFRELDRAVRGALSDLVASGDFGGAADEILVYHARVKTAPRRIILLGLGEKDKLDAEKARRAGGKLAKTAHDLKLKRLVLGGAVPDSGLDPHRITGALVEGLLLGLYRYEDWKTKDKKPVVLKTLQVAPEDGAGMARHQAALSRIAVGCAASLYARNLGNRPANDMTPTALAAAARELAQAAKMKCTVLDYKKAEAEGMHAFCGVAKGSAEAPAFIIVEYSGGATGARPVVLVGKGLTFDSGGISIKPADAMDEMKFDMCGAAAVLGTLKAAAELKLPLNLVGLIPAVENMPGGRAYKPGDVLKSLGGPTIEIKNTDAEGRVVLADALAYAARYKPAAVIDLATLTGACVIALGAAASGLFSNDKDLARRILAAGEETGERCWELPIWDDYRELVKSEVADVKNVAGRPAGAITAACFLLAFAEKYRWAHLDIAGTAYLDHSNSYLPKGATGHGVRLLLHLLESWPAPQPARPAVRKGAVAARRRKESQ